MTSSTMERLSSIGVKSLPLNSSTCVNLQVRKKAENNRGREDQESLSFKTSWKGGGKCYL